MIRLLLLVIGSAAAFAADRVTFTEHIAPIVYGNCVSCHRPGEAAPFALITFDDVRKRGALIATVTARRYMPPWHAEHGYGEFQGERRLTDVQIAAIGEWVKQGMPEGDRAKMPKLPQFTEGWQSGKPDLVLEMPLGYEVPSSGPDIYRNFALPTGLAEDKWVRAVEFRPAARKSVHHALFAYFKTGQMKDYEGKDGKPGFTGMNGLGAGVGVQANSGQGALGGWAVGTQPMFLANGQAQMLPKNSDFVLQMHFHPTGKAEMEKATIGLYFASQAPERKMMDVSLPSVFAVGAGLDIPAGAKDYVIKDSRVMAADIRVIGVAAHAHYLGKEFKATATLPDGTVKPLIWIKDWDFNWQEQYNYKDPVLLPKGTRVDASISYDNSAENPHNPTHPPKRVLWGEQSFDEMGGIGLLVEAVNKADETAISTTESDGQRAAIQAGGKDGTVKRFLDSQARARAVATARMQDITIFDREGKTIRKVGDPGLFNFATFSPDGTHVAVIKSDRATGNPDVWVYDVATGKGTQLTDDQAVEGTPMFSPDGKQVAYVLPISDGGNYSVIMSKAADGTGAAKMLHKHQPNEGIFITDWSKDGALSFWGGDWIYLLPPSGAAVQHVKGRGGRFSHDGKRIAYASNESGKFEIYTAPAQAPGGKPELVASGAIGGISWGADDKELFYLVGQVLTSKVEGQDAKSLFRIPPTLGVAQTGNIGTRDGQSFVFVPAQPLVTTTQATQQK